MYLFILVDLPSLIGMLAILESIIIIIRVT